MRSLGFGSLAVTTLLALSSATPASAAPMQSRSAMKTATGNGFEDVQWRAHRHWRGDHGRRHYHHGWGPALGGLVAGAVIGGAIANSQARTDAMAYCAQRYKSYDPGSGTYLGFDGMRHPCP
jgi:hypothetical protein